MKTYQHTIHCQVTSSVTEDTIKVMRADARDDIAHNRMNYVVAAHQRHPEDDEAFALEVMNGALRVGVQAYLRNLHLGTGVALRVAPVTSKLLRSKAPEEVVA